MVVGTVFCAVCCVVVVVVAVAAVVVVVAVVAVVVAVAVVVVVAAFLRVVVLVPLAGLSSTGILESLELPGTWASVVVVLLLLLLLLVVVRAVGGTGVFVGLQSVGRRHGGEAVVGVVRRR